MKLALLNDAEVYECLKGIETGGADGGLMTNKDAIAHIMAPDFEGVFSGFSHCCRYVRFCMVTFLAHELKLTVQAKGRSVEVVMRAYN